jgi:hypothetical protein
MSNGMENKQYEGEIKRLKKIKKRKEKERKGKREETPQCERKWSIIQKLRHFTR